MSKQNLLSEMREVLRRMHYSIHTERSYCDWVKRFIQFHHLQARESLFVDAEKKVEDYLSHLVVQANVATSTQNQAFNALVFLYKQGVTITGSHPVKNNIFHVYRGRLARKTNPNKITTLP